MSCLKYKILIFCCLCAWGANHAQAQSNGTNSSYSRFGLGLPADQSQSFNRSMGGVAQGLRSSYRINQLNPASYSAMDSLTFVFDVGLSVQRTFMKQDGMSKTLNNTSFDFVNAAFRLRKNLGMSLGFVPYTRIGYSFYTDKPAKNSPQIITHQEFKSADPTGMQTTGGLHQAYIGAGWRPLKGFSVGLNLGVLWGNINHYMLQTTTQNGATITGDNIKSYDTASLLTWKTDFGVQYQTLLNTKNRLTFGATLGIGHTINSEATHIETNDTAYTKKGYQIPWTYSVGVAWEHAERLTLAADFTFEQWGNCTTPQFDASTKTLSPSTGTYENRFRINTGLEYVPARYDRRYSKRINYRAGAFYSSPYVKVNGMQGADRLVLSL